MSAQTLNPGMQPTDVYGGDEVSAIILDAGYSSVRAGFAGEDTPKGFVNSHYGILGGQHRFGDDTIHNPLANLEIRNPMTSDGCVEDWEAATKLWEYAITSRLTSFPQSNRANGQNNVKAENGDVDMGMEGTDDNEKSMEEHPLLMTEPAWNGQKNREKAIEIAMEGWGCPAFWLARNSVMAAFAAGKATALVIDVGASTATVQAIHDGLILKKSVQKSPLAGNFVNSQIRTMFTQMDPRIDLKPHYMVAAKTAVDAGAPAQATDRKFDIAPTQSFRALEEDRVLSEFKESVVQVWGTRLAAPNPHGGTGFDAARSQLGGRVFEFPDGSNQLWGGERYNVTEGIFDAASAMQPTLAPYSAYEFPTVTKAMTIPEMVRTSLHAVDIDIRPHLLANIVVTGATTLLNGFTERIHFEVSQLFPGARIKIQAAGLTSERRFGAWIGGSVVGSLGTFHQMWIGRSEYDEFGANVVERRCK